MGGWVWFLQWPSVDYSDIQGAYNLPLDLMNLVVCTVLSFVQREECRY